MNKFFKDPLVHFILLGALLFGFNAVWSAGRSADKTIRVNQDTVERLKTIYAGEQRREPNADEVKALISAYVEEEALSREAERLGLGEDDTIIRRRLAQKIRFMTENVGKPELPKESVLQEWYSDNQESFKEPTRITFHHVYFSPDKSSDLDASASAARKQLDQGEDWKSIGDPFIMSRNLTRVSGLDIERGYGKPFARSVIKLDPNIWSTPIESAFGLHLVFISEKQKERQPSFEEIKDRIALAWQDETQRAENARKIKSIVESYDIVFEAPQ